MNNLITLCTCCNPIVNSFTTNWLSPLSTCFGIIISAFIAVKAWHVQAEKNKEFEIFKMRFAKRNEMLHSFLIFWNNFKEIVITEKLPWGEHQPELTEKLRTASNNFVLYGNVDEQEKMNGFIKFIDSKEKLANEEDIKAFAKLASELEKLTVGNLRKELKISS